MDFISPEIEAYAKTITSPETAVLARLNRNTHASILRPRMLSGHLQGKLLELISRMMRPKRILEIGTFTGYSAICLATGLSENGVLHTIDHNPELEDFTRSYILEAGMEKKIIQHVGKALDIIPGINEVFDLVFIDADKENLIRYFDLSFERLRTGGIILVDNVLWSGKVVQSHPTPENENAFKAGEKAHTGMSTDRETRCIQQFNAYIRDHKGVEKLLLPFRDGLMICIKL